MQQELSLSPKMGRPARTHKKEAFNDLKDGSFVAFKGRTDPCLGRGDWDPGLGQISPDRPFYVESAGKWGAARARNQSD